LYIIENDQDIEKLPSDAIPIGGGSNILINPNISKPLIKVSARYCEFEFHGHQIVCSAGASIAQILKWMSEKGLSGLEFATGVPATIGGMVYMNFECWGNDVSSMVDSVYMYEKENGFRWIKRQEYQVAYRWTSFHDFQCIILAVKLNVHPSTTNKVKEKMQEYLSERKKKQPVLKSTFGSVFKNPLPQKAGELVDQLGLKGTTMGDAMISNHHANFFENFDKATFDDTVKLIKLIQNKVQTRYNIKLECEVQIIQ
jgi:UDP-N-acetylmuramate dehydrogenase